MTFMSIYLSLLGVAVIGCIVSLMYMRYRVNAYLVSVLALFNYIKDRDSLDEFIKYVGDKFKEDTDYS